MALTKAETEDLALIKDELRYTWEEMIETYKLYSVTQETAHLQKCLRIIAQRRQLQDWQRRLESKID